MDLKDQFYNYCLSFLNQSYRWGGDDPMSGWDCGGLVQELYQFLDLAPKTDKGAAGLFDLFHGQAYQGIRKLGALAFYGKERISHVAMFMDDTRIIEAGGGDQRTQTLADAINRNAYVRIRPYTHRKDLMAVLAPHRLPW